MGSHVVGEERTRFADKLRKQYEKGASVRALAEKTGRSYGFVHRLLCEAGVHMRPHGGYRPGTDVVTVEGVAVSPAMVRVLGVLLAAGRSLWTREVCDRVPQPHSTTRYTLLRLVSVRWVELRTSGRKQSWRLTRTGQRAAETVLRPAHNKAGAP